MPSTDYVDSYGEMMREGKDRSKFDRDSKTYRFYAAGYENFLRDAIRYLYRMGDRARAEKYYHDLRSGGMPTPATKWVPLQTGFDHKTSIMFNTANKPGALVSVLHAFEHAGINLTHIDKRPSGRSNWSYTFFIDAQGHKDDATMVAALKEAQTHCQHLAVLGSYPRSKRIL